MFCVTHPGWIRRMLLDTSQEVVSPVDFPELLRFEVVCPYVNEYACMSTIGEAVLQVWTLGEIVEEAAEELPGGWVHIVRSRSASEDCTDEDAARPSPPSRSSYMLARPNTLDPCLCRLSSLKLDDLQLAGEAPDAVQAPKYLQPLGEVPDVVQVPDDLQPHGEAPDSVQVFEGFQLAAEVPDAVQARADLQVPGEVLDRVHASRNLPLPMREP